MIPVANPVIGEEEAKAVYDTVKSCWISMGKKVEEFEDRFKKEVNAKFTIAVNSGTSALHLALAALGIKAGDEVIMPTLTFISTANAVLYQNAKPVLVECDPRTYNTTAEDIEKGITRKTKAIVPVDMNGMPVDYDAILEVGEKHNIPVIADSAESLGAVYKNKKVGSIAQMHIFSFFANKNVTTGEGGMITTNNKELWEKMKILRNQGQDYRYHHIEVGYNYRMTDIAAAIGIAQLKRLQWVINGKESIAKRYNEAFSNRKHIEAPFVPEYVRQHAWYMYAIKVKKDRDMVNGQLNKKNIETRLSFPPIHTQPCYQKIFGYNDNSFPISFSAWKSLIDIPIWPGLGKENQDHIIKAVLDSLN